MMPATAAVAALPNAEQSSWPGGASSSNRHSVAAMEAAAGTPSSGAMAAVQVGGAQEVGAAAIAGGGEKKARGMDKSSRATKVKAPKTKDPKTKVAKVFHEPAVKPKDIEAAEGIAPSTSLPGRGSAPFFEGFTGTGTCFCRGPFKRSRLRLVALLCALLPAAAVLPNRDRAPPPHCAEVGVDDEASCVRLCGERDVPAPRFGMDIFTKFGAHYVTGMPNNQGGVTAICRCGTSRTEPLGCVASFAGLTRSPGPSVAPSEPPTADPSATSTKVPTKNPSMVPSEIPVASPTTTPTEPPTGRATTTPTELLSADPSGALSETPTKATTSTPCTPATCQWRQRGTDIDGEAAGDYSGRVVALSGDGAIFAVGAYGNDAAGFTAGHVRVFWWNGTVAVQRGADIDGEAAGDWSGGAVALSGDGTTLAVGASSNAAAGSYAGHARVFWWNGTAAVWVQRGADIDGEAAWDYSGYSVALSSDGATLAIGAYGNHAAGSYAGHVRVFWWNGTAAVWVQRGADIDGEAAGDYSGSSVALSGDGATLAVGADGNGAAGSDAGHVRVFWWNGTAAVWVQRGADIDGEAAGDYSGFSVALSSDGATLAVGAYGNDAAGYQAGHVRVFWWNGTAAVWVQRGADIDGEAAGDWSGYSVALSSDGATLAVGAYLNDAAGSDAGHVRVFWWNGTAAVWVQRGVDIDGEAAGDKSGSSVALSSDGATLAVGANGNNAAGSNAGHVRVFWWA